MKTESRSFEVRAAKGKDFVLEGRAVSYNTVSTSELAPGVREQFAPGAFTKSLASGRGTDLVCLLNHDFKGLPLGRVSNRTLQVSDGPEGLDFSCQLDKTNPAHQAVFASVSRGDICSCSFTFTDPVDVFTQGENCTLRTVTSAELWDVSVVTLPFYGDDATNVAARSAAAVANSELLAKVQNLPVLWEQQSRAHAIALDISRSANTQAAQVRSAEDDEDDLTDEIQKALAERFGVTRSGAHPAHFLVRYDAARCYTRHLPTDTRMRCTYQRDDTDEDYTFGEPENDPNYSDDDNDRSLAAQQAQSDEALRIRMAIAAGRM